MNYLEQYNKDKYLKVIKSFNFSPSHFELLKHLVLDFLIFSAIGFCLIYGSVATSILAQVLIPILMFRSFALMHDAAHFTVSKNRTLNNLIGYISGAFCILPYSPWRLSHLEHHRWAGNTEKDPVMKIVKDYPNNSRLKNNFLKMSWRGWIPVLALLQHVVFWSIGFTAIFRKKPTRMATLIPWLNSYLIPVLIYSVLYKAQILTPFNVLPGILLYFAMVEIINFPHHLELPQYGGGHKLKVWEQYKVSRSCHYPSWLSKYILNHFNLHTEHHLFPQAPWYTLDQLKEKLTVSLGSKYNHCTGNSWIVAARKKNLDQILVYKEVEHSEEEKKAA